MIAEFTPDFASDTHRKPTNIFFKDWLPRLAASAEALFLRSNIFSILARV